MGAMFLSMSCLSASTRSGTCCVYNLAPPPAEQVEDPEQCQDPVTLGNTAAFSLGIVLIVLAPIIGIIIVLIS